MLRIAPWLIALALASAHAATLEGRVTGVIEGDALTLRDGNGAQHRVRLWAIDAPEKGQPFGERARECLARWVSGRTVLVEWNRRDAKGQVLGVVIVDGHDVNLELVRAGCAWWHREQAREQPPDEREVYELAEKAARERRLGLWAELKPVPPWEWRPAPKDSSFGRPSPIQFAANVNTETVTPDTFFKTLQRPGSPNSWLVAPAGFAIKPDAVAPVFTAPVPVVRKALRDIVQSDGAAVVEESGNGMHIVATTRLLRFQDDVWVLFLVLSHEQSTLAAYSASRAGYWDLGTNRRRLADWIGRVQKVVAKGTT